MIARSQLEKLASRTGSTGGVKVIIITCFWRRRSCALPFCFESFYYQQPGVKTSGRDYDFKHVGCNRHFVG